MTSTAKPEFTNEDKNNRQFLKSLVFLPQDESECIQVIAKVHNSINNILGSNNDTEIREKNLWDAVLIKQSDIQSEVLKKIEMYDDKIQTEIKTMTEKFLSITCRHSETDPNLANICLFQFLNPKLESTAKASKYIFKKWKNEMKNRGKSFQNHLDLQKYLSVEADTKTSDTESEIEVNERKLKFQLHMYFFGLVSPNTAVCRINCDVYSKLWIGGGALEFLSVKQFRSFRPRFMLHSNALLYALRLVNVCSQEYTNIIGFHNYSNALKKNRIPDVIKDLHRDDVTKKKVCIYSLKCEKMHWTFYRIDSKNYTNNAIQVEYYDSLGSSLTKTDDPCCEIAVDNWYLISKVIDPDFNICDRKKLQTSIKNMIPTQVQNVDSNDCGIFVFLWIALLTHSFDDAQSMKIQFIDQSYIRTYDLRYHIALSILRNKLQLPPPHQCAV